ncbi:class I SAM-dependent methyltransferase [Candidatus Pelagibacter ubique]|nr:class I SAM-dependent methyltransferase [Candidatus Pelagibacter ubique]
MKQKSYIKNKFLNAKREIVDENIYLKQPIKKNPTSRFLQSLDLIKKDLKNKIKFCDIGCGNGSYLNFVKEKFPNNEYYGIEKSLKLYQKCKKNIPFAKILKMDIEKPIKSKIKFDCITMLGVLLNFDDPKISIKNCLKLLKINGKLLIYSNFNEYPLDIITRTKRCSNNYWELGWNIHSKNSIEKILKLQKVKNFKWIKFNINFNLKKSDDFMRAWTVNLNGKKTLTNGTNQYLNGQFLLITK